MRRHRRTFTVILLLLLLGGGGAIVNVAVAWRCAARMPFGVATPMVATVTMKHETQLIALVVQRNVGLVRFHFVTLLERNHHGIPSFELPRWSKLRDYPLSQHTDDANRSGMWNTEIASGWPLIALGAWPNTVPSLDSVTMNPNPAIQFVRHQRILPVKPLWPGFAINTIFYAAILWVVSFTPGMVRRRIRRRRGLCPACAYPIGSSPVCTECGAAV